MAATREASSVRWALSSVLLLVSCLCLTSTVLALDPVVTTNGPIEGIEQISGVVSYLGIPYALAPTGDLRWRAPLPYNISWTAENPYNASQYGPGCYQIITNTDEPYFPTSEDCLSLNVFVPVTNDDAAIPARVFIHGGSFTSGASLLYPGETLAAISQSIIVTINYRLNALGFLATAELAAEDPLLNWGIQDQRLALTWVKENIAAFGGNSSNILLFGESAGGASVVMHLLATRSRGLFDKVLLESPAPWSYPTVDEAIKFNEVVLTQAGQCTSFDIDCLRSLPVDVLQHLPLSGVPVINGQEGDISDTLFNLLKAGDYPTDMDMLVGNNDNEGAIFIYDKTQTVTINETVYTDLLYGIATNISGFPYFNKDQVTEVASWYRNYYTEEGPFNTLSSLFGDWGIVCGTRMLVDSWSNRTTNNVWRYIYSHPLANYLPFLNATHSVELPIVFAAPIFGVPLTDDELVFSKTIVSYWSSFHFYGDPNTAGYNSYVWPLYDVNNPNATMINLNYPASTPAMDVYSYFCDLWTDKYFFNQTMTA